MTPIAGGIPVATPVVAVVFAAGAAQLWTVPANVTQVIDAYVWGAGGSSDNGQAVNGGGGGGGGAFCTTGPLTVVPGSVFALSVDAGGGAASTTITNPSGTLLAQANSGAAGAASTGGAGGTAPTGVIKRAGGNGATTAIVRGGGGGGAAGNNAVGGNAGAPGAPGVGGGAATILGYGAGGNGGNGSNANVNGIPGHSPGGGGGGGGATTGLLALGADGQAVIFYVPSPQQQVISLDPRPDVVAGLGTLNFMLPNVAPFLLSDELIGNGICEEWWGISGVDGVSIQVLEYSYGPDEILPAN